MVKYINDAPGVPGAIGPYSQAVIAGGMAYLSGQIPLDPANGQMVSGGIKEQTTRVMDNLKALLAHLKVDFGSVARSTIYLTDLGNFQVVNEIYSKYLGNEARPARATVQVSALPKGSLVEIDMVAHLG